MQVLLKIAMAIWPAAGRVINNTIWPAVRNRNNNPNENPNPNLTLTLKKNGKEKFKEKKLKKKNYQKFTWWGIELARFEIATLESNQYTTTAGSTEIKIKMYLR